MASLADKLIETIENDIQALEQAQGADDKAIRKECNMISKRISDLEKLAQHDPAKLESLKKRVDVIKK